MSRDPAPLRHHQPRQAARAAPHGGRASACGCSGRRTSPSPLPEVLEDGATFEENAAKKAAAWARWSGLHTLADDSGLCVDALGGAPGVHSARWSELEPAPAPSSPVCELAEGAAGELGAEAGRAARDERNNDKLLRALRGVPDALRGAEYRAVLCLARPDGTVLALGGGAVPGPDRPRAPRHGGVRVRPALHHRGARGRPRADHGRARRGGEGRHLPPRRGLPQAAPGPGGARAGPLTRGHRSATDGRSRKRQDSSVPRFRGVAQPGSAPALGAGGRGSESRRPDVFDKQEAAECDELRARSSVG